LERVGDFAAFLGQSFDEAMTYAALRKAESIGRPVGSKDWLAGMEQRTGLTLAAGKRGPQPNARWLGVIARHRNFVILYRNSCTLRVLITCV